MLLSIVIFLMFALPMLLILYIVDYIRQMHMSMRVKKIHQKRDDFIASNNHIKITSFLRPPARRFTKNKYSCLSLISYHLHFLRLRLDQAGIPLSDVGISFGFIITISIITIISKYIFKLTFLQSFVIGITFSILISYFLINYFIKQRKDLFIKQFPDAIDLIVRGVKSGLSVTESLQAASNESSGHISILFQEVTGNIKLGKSLQEALVDMSRKVPAVELRFFVITITIQQETGANITEILQSLSSMMRKRAQAHLKVRAISSEARVSAFIIGLLPFIVAFLLYLINPSYIAQLFTNQLGISLLSFGILSIFIGIIVIIKMVRFEI